MSDPTDLPALPPAQGTPYRLALVCLGNICRSPIADVVLSAELADAGLSELVQVTSAGTGDWHVGQPMDDRAAATLREAGYDPTRHRAQQLDHTWGGNDLILTMDAQNRRDVLAHGIDAERVLMFRDFDPDLPAAASSRDVPDPYHGGQDGFTAVLETVRRTSGCLVSLLRERVAADGTGDHDPHKRD